jgi:hypothetical protein
MTHDGAVVEKAFAVNTRVMAEPFPDGMMGRFCRIRAERSDVLFAFSETAVSTIQFGMVVRSGQSIVIFSPSGSPLYLLTEGERAGLLLIEATHGPQTPRVVVRF